MILEKKATLFIIYDGEKPIGIMLNFMSNNILFGTMSVFDIAYAKYNVSSVNIMKLIEWCLNNHIKFLDFQRGILMTKYVGLMWHIILNTIYCRIVALSMQSVSL